MHGCHFHGPEFNDFSLSVAVETSWVQTEDIKVLLFVISWGVALESHVSKYLRTDIRCRMSFYWNLTVDFACSRRLLMS